MTTKIGNVRLPNVTAANASAIVDRRVRFVRKKRLPQTISSSRRTVRASRRPRSTTPSSVAAEIRKVAASMTKSGCQLATAAMTPASEKPKSSIVFSEEDIRLLALTKKSAGTRIGKNASFARFYSLLDGSTEHTPINTPERQLRHS